MHQRKKVKMIHKIYLHKTFKLGIFGLSIYILGRHKFSLRFEISYGWDK